jgi:hypothetical protein
MLIAASPELDSTVFSLELEAGAAALEAGASALDDGAATELEDVFSTSAELETRATSLELVGATTSALDAGTFESIEDDDGAATTELDDSSRVTTDEELCPKSRDSKLDEYVICELLKSGAEVESSEQFTKAIALATITPFKNFDFIL